MKKVHPFKCKNVMTVAIVAIAEITEATEEIVETIEGARTVEAEESIEVAKEVSIEAAEEETPVHSLDLTRTSKSALVARWQTWTALKS